MGYFSFATKVVKMKRNTLAGKKKKRFCKFAEYDEDNHCFFISLPLIGQSGNYLLQMLCDLSNY